MLLCLPLSNVVTVFPTVSILFDTLSVSESDDFVSAKWNALISFNISTPETEICHRIFAVIFTVVQIYYHHLQKKKKNTLKHFNSHFTFKIWIYNWLINMAYIQYKNIMKYLGT